MNGISACKRRHQKVSSLSSPHCEDIERSRGLSKDPIPLAPDIKLSASGTGRRHSSAVSTPSLWLAVREALANSCTPWTSCSPRGDFLVDHTTGGVKLGCRWASWEDGDPGSENHWEQGRKQAFPCSSLALLPRMPSLS